MRKCGAHQKHTHIHTHRSESAGEWEGMEREGEKGRRGKGEKGRGADGKRMREGEGEREVRKQKMTLPPFYNDVELTHLTL